MTSEAAAVDRVFRSEFGRAVALLARVLGDIGLAEGAVQDAYLAALRRWPAASATFTTLLGWPRSPIS